MNDTVLRFLEHAEPADYRHFLRESGFDFAAHEYEAAGEHLQCTDVNSDIGAVGRLVELDWDTDFFGVPAGRLEGFFFRRDDGGPEIRRQIVRRLVAHAEDRGLSHLTCRVRADDLFLIQAFEAEGFRLVDLMTVYTREIKGGGTVPKFDRAVLWPVLEDWIHGMEWGRLFHDAHIDRATAERFYLDVSRHYLENGAHLTVHSVDGVPAGVAIGVADEEVSRRICRRFGVLWLIIVAPEHQGRGIGALLFEAFCREFGQSCDLLEIGTQIYNLPANRIYLNAGCTPRSHLCTFHRWSDVA
jgi:GNAT superfamily N-acetyltransferase